MPANTKPVQPMTAERHLDLQADLHFFFDTLVTGKTVLDVGAGLGKSKARIRHNRVTTYEPSEHCCGLVDVCGPEMPAGLFDVVTAFEVLEHVEDDLGFLRRLDARASQAVFLTTPNWEIGHRQSDHHYREYTQEEFRNVLDAVWPYPPPYILFGYYKDAEGGWCEQIQRHVPAVARKFAALVCKGLTQAEATRITAMYSVGRLDAVAGALDGLRG